ncbi:MAG: hypothetical protein HN416_15750 [Nitrospina sp.]|nr:hypothetical protein [Nitrospina sp.]
MSNFWVFWVNTSIATYFAAMLRRQGSFPHFYASPVAAKLRKNRYNANPSDCPLVDSAVKFDYIIGVKDDIFSSRGNLKMIKKIHILVSLLVFGLIFGVTYVNAADYEQEFVVRPEPILSGGANRLDLRFNIRHGKVTLKLSDDPDFIVKVLVGYDKKELTPISSESFSEGTFSVDFSSGDFSDQDMASPLQIWEIQIGKYDLETNLTLDFTGVQTHMNLGGMPLDTLALNFKGTQATVDISEPTFFSVRKLGITIEGTFLTLANTGNTNFEKFQLKAVGSSMDLDFRGAYAAGDYNADFNLSGSSARLSLPVTAGALVVHRPENRPVALAGGGWSKELSGSPAGYMTDDYEDQESKLNLYISSLATSVHIKREGTNLQYQLSY